jgi:uncharacterized membrane protein
MARDISSTTHSEEDHDEKSARFDLGDDHLRPDPDGDPVSRRHEISDVTEATDMDLVPALARWLHFLAGIMWIGLLYYFNFVQVPALKAAGADGTAAGITKHVAPRALLYFRWSAVVTWLAGAALLGGNFVGAFTFSKGLAGIGIGAWLGTIMLINVWVLIWPNQQKILGMTPATDEEKAKARRVALLASRTNMMLSMPMLFFMAGGWSHRALFGL